MSYFLTIILLVVAWVVPGYAELYSRSWPVMGTYAEVQVDADDSEVAKSAFDLVRASFAKIDRLMSIYRDDSDFSKINRNAGKGYVAVSPLVSDLIQKGRRAYCNTDAAFSLNVLQAGINLGLKPGVPHPEATVRNGDDIIVDRVPSRVYLRHRGMALDPGGIAKGYALDLAADNLRAGGVTRFFLELGRSVLAGLPPRGTSGWWAQLAGETETLLVQQESISVSRQFVVSDTGHILNPKTGKPVAGNYQVAVSASVGWVADMASTAIFVKPKLQQSIQARYPQINWVKIRRFPDAKK